MAALSHTLWWILAIKRELAVLSSQRQSFIQAFMFFLMFAIFFPMALPYDAKLLHELFPGIIWFAASFSIFLACEHFYLKDLDAGYLEQWLVHDKPLSVYVFIKILVQGGLILVSILAAVFILAVIYQLSLQELGVSILSLVAGLPGLIAFTAMVSAFGVFGHGRSSIMLLVLLPLILPFLVFGSAIIQLKFSGLPILGLLAMLGALSLLILMFLPFASAYILRISLEQGL
jgi:heme exporter protein B